MSNDKAKAALLAAGLGVVGSGIYLAFRYLRTPRPTKDRQILCVDNCIDGIYQPIRLGWYDGRFYTQDKAMARRLKGIREHCMDGGVEDPVALWSIDGRVMSSYETCRDIWERLNEARHAGKVQDKIDMIEALEKEAVEMLEKHLKYVSTPL